MNVVEKSALTARIIIRRIVSWIIVIVVILAIYWCFCNWRWILYKTTPQYDRRAYGLNWKTDISTATDKASRESKKLLIAYLDENNKASDKLRERFRSDDFQYVENNYVLLLIDYPADRSILKPREKSFCEEMVKKFSIHDFGVLVVADPSNGSDMTEIRRIAYKNETTRQLLNKIAGGKFEPKRWVDSTPRIYHPVPISWIIPNKRSR